MIITSNKRRKNFIIFAVIFSFVVFSCAGDGEAIRFATWDSGESLEVQKTIARRFEEMNPGVKVQVEAYGDGFDQKLAVGFGAKSPPDVMYMWDFPTYRPALESLNNLINKDPDFRRDQLKDYYPAMLNYSSMDGDILGLPVGYTSHVIYYNKRLFDQAGLEYPGQGWTWADLRRMARKISEIDDETFGFAVSTKPDSYDFELYLWTSGSAYLSPDGSTADAYLNSPESVRIIQFLVDMVKEGSAWGAQSGISKTFRSGKLGMQESGIWPLARHKEVFGKNLGVAPLPAWDADYPPVSVINSSSISMAKDSGNKDLAWKFIKFYTSPEAVTMRAEVDLPALKSVALSMGYNTDEYYAPFYSMLGTAENHIPSFFLNSSYSRIAEKIVLAIEKSITDATNNEPVNVQENLDEAVKESQRFFE